MSVYQEEFVLVRVRDTMINPTLIKATFNWSGLQFRCLVHPHHQDGETWLFAGRCGIREGTEKSTP